MDASREPNFPLILFCWHSNMIYSRAVFLTPINQYIDPRLDNNKFHSLAVSHLFSLLNESNRRNTA
jgi:hypothetical protein